MFLPYSLFSPLQSSTTVQCLIFAACFDLYTNAPTEVSTQPTCATDLLNISHTSRQTGLWPHPDPLLLESPRQGVLAWLYPSEQQPGLRPAHQIDRVCARTLVADANTVHLLILIHSPSIDARAKTHLLMCGMKKLLRDEITSYLMEHNTVNVIN